MSENNEEKVLLKEEDNCGCSDSACCQPKSRSLWQRIAFVAVVLLAAGIIAFELFCAPPASSFNTKGCCADTTK